MNRRLVFALPAVLPLAALACVSDPTPTPVTPHTDAGVDASRASPDAGRAPDASDGGHAGGEVDGSPATDAAVEAATTVDVHGTVSTYAFGLPAAGATVKIGAQTATTAADGSFAIDDVVAPYDLTVVYQSGTKTVRHIVEGLTRPDPTIELQGFPTETKQFGQIAGTVNGPTFPLAANHYVQIVSSATGNGTSLTTLAPGATTGQFADHSVSWYGGTTATHRIYAIEYTLGADGLPTAYGGIGTTLANVSFGEVTNDVSIDLTSVPSTATTVTTTQPSPTTGTKTGFGIWFDVGCDVEFRSTFASPASILVPTTTVGAPFAFVQGTFPAPATGSVFAAKRNIVPGTPVALDTGSPIVALPASGAVFAATTAFSWDARPSGVYVVRFWDVPHTALITLVTRRTSFTWPADALPAPGTYSWGVLHQMDHPNVDAALAGRNLSGIVAFESSAEQSFTVPNP